MNLLGDEDTDVFLTDAKEKVQKKVHSYGVKKNKVGEEKQEKFEFDSDLAINGYYPNYGMYDPYDLRW